jgi:hypothetical protein
MSRLKTMFGIECMAVIANTIFSRHICWRYVVFPESRDMTTMVRPGVNAGGAGLTKAIGCVHTMHREFAAVSSLTCVAPNNVAMLATLFAPTAAATNGFGAAMILETK